MNQGRSRVRLLSVVPGASRLTPIIRDFERGGPGIVTALADDRLSCIRTLLSGEHELEVMAFGALVSRSLLASGRPARMLAGSGLIVEAIADACDRLPDDSPFALSARYPGTHRAIANTLSELRSWGFTSDLLREAADKLDPALAAKLESLAQIQSEVQKTLDSLGRILVEEQIDRCAEELGPPEAIGRVLIVADEFSPRAAQWIRWAKESGGRITLVIPGAPGADLYRWTAAVVHEFGEPEARGETTPFLAALFSDGQSGGDLLLSVESAADPLAECEWAVRGCLSQIRLGANPSRLGILVRDLEGYAPLLDAAAQRLGVPLRMPRRAPLLTNRFARFVLDILEALASHDVRRLGPVLRSTYGGLERSAQNLAVEAAREAFRAGPQAWDTLATWAENMGDEFQWLRDLLAWRKQAASGPSTLIDWASQLRLLLTALPLPAARLFGGTPESSKDVRAQSALQRSIAERASVQSIGGLPTLTFSRFVTLCRELWRSTDVSVPPAEIGVTVVDRSRALGECDALFVLGMLEGVFPRRRSEDPILTDAEREALSGAAGGAPLRTSHDRAREERDEFYNVCAASRHQLVLSYPLTDEERDNVPAFYLEEAMRAHGRSNIVQHPRLNLAPALENCLAPADVQMRASYDGPRWPGLDVRLQTDLVKQKLAWLENSGIRPRELKDALECPFRFFMRRRLKLSPDRPRGRWRSLARLPADAKLPLQKDRESAEAALHAALDAQLDALVVDVPHWELTLLRNGGRRLIREWVEREFLAREQWERQEIVAEVPFGAEGLRDRLSSKLKLAGTVPVMSRVGPYRVIHLFESGIPEKTQRDDWLSESDELYYGVHMLAQFEHLDGGVALEIESMGKKRVMLVLPRLSNHHLGASTALPVWPIFQRDDNRTTVKDFHAVVKTLSAKAMLAVASLDVEARQGDHCDRCDLGELCRRSLRFGEEDSPFASSDETDV